MCHPIIIHTIQQYTIHCTKLSPTIQLRTLLMYYTYKIYFLDVKVQLLHPYYNEDKIDEPDSGKYCTIERHYIPDEEIVKKTTTEKGKRASTSSIGSITSHIVSHWYRLYKKGGLFEVAAIIFIILNSPEYFN